MDIIECLVEVAKFHGGTLANFDHKGCETCGLTNDQAEEDGCAGCESKLKNRIKKRKSACKRR